MSNPVIRDYLGDPYVLKDGGDYYLTATCGDPALGGKAFQCYHSTDLAHWSAPKTILDFDNVAWANHMAWAPTMVKYNGHYYFCFCADQQIGIAVCDEPMGTYRDILGAPLVRYEQYGFQTIDPCFFLDDDNRVYLAFGQGKCYLVELDLAPDHARFIGEPVSISDQFYWQTSVNPRNFDVTIYNEATDLVKINGKYLLSWSIYDVRDVRYRVRYAWADNVFGPYIMPVDESHDNVMIRGQGPIQCTGHACMAEYKGDWYLFYGRYVMPRNGYHREMCCDKVEFLDDVHMRVIPT